MFISCPHCRAGNRTQRELCWKCHKYLRIGSSIPYSTYQLRSGLKSRSNPCIKRTGTVIYQTLEGGFYTIQADTGELYDVQHSDPKFLIKLKDGTKVFFQGCFPNEAIGCYHMKGQILHLIEVNQINPGISTFHKYQRNAGEEHYEFFDSDVERHNKRAFRYPNLRVRWKTLANQHFTINKSRAAAIRHANVQLRREEALNRIHPIPITKESRKEEQIIMEQWKDEEDPGYVQEPDDDPRNRLRRWRNPLNQNEYEAILGEGITELARARKEADPRKRAYLAGKAYARAKIADKHRDTGITSTYPSQLMRDAEKEAFSQTGFEATIAGRNPIRKYRPHRGIKLNPENLWRYKLALNATASDLSSLRNKIEGFLSFIDALKTEENIAPAGPWRGSFDDLKI